MIDPIVKPEAKGIAQKEKGVNYIWRNETWLRVWPVGGESWPLNPMAMRCLRFFEVEGERILLGWQWQLQTVTEQQPLESESDIVCVVPFFICMYVSMASKLTKWWKGHDNRVLCSTSTYYIIRIQSPNDITKFVLVFFFCPVNKTHTYGVG